MKFPIIITSSFLVLIHLNFFIPFDNQETNQTQDEFKTGFSDTNQIQFNKDYFIKIKSPYFNGHLFSSKNSLDWEKLNLGILLENFDSVVELGPETTNKIAYQIMPRGLLKINDSTSFIIGIKSTFDQQGMILRTTNSGKSWKPTIHPVTQTQMSPHDLVFINSRIGLAFFGVNQSEYIQYGISLDGGETWEFLRSKTRQIEFQKRKLKISVDLDFKGRLIRKIAGKYSTDKGKTFNSISISH